MKKARLDRPDERIFLQRCGILQNDTHDDRGLEMGSEAVG